MTNYIPLFFVNIAVYLPALFLFTFYLKYQSEATVSKISPFFGGPGLDSTSPERRSRKKRRACKTRMSDPIISTKQLCITKLLPASQLNFSTPTYKKELFLWWISTPNLLAVMPKYKIHQNHMQELKARRLQGLFTNFIYFA